MWSSNSLRSLPQAFSYVKQNGLFVVEGLVSDVNYIVVILFSFRPVEITYFIKFPNNSLKNKFVFKYTSDAWIHSCCETPRSYKENQSVLFHFLQWNRLPFPLFSAQLHLYVHVEKYIWFCLLYVYRYTKGVTFAQ